MGRIGCTTQMHVVLDCLYTYHIQSKSYISIHISIHIHAYLEEGGFCDVFGLPGEEGGAEKKGVGVGEVVAHHLCGDDRRGEGEGVCVWIVRGGCTSPVVQKDGKCGEGCQNCVGHMIRREPEAHTQSHFVIPVSDGWIFISCVSLSFSLPLRTSVLVGPSLGRGPRTRRCQNGFSLITWEETHPVVWLFVLLAEIWRWIWGFWDDFFPLIFPGHSLGSLGRCRVHRATHTHAGGRAGKPRTEDEADDEQPVLGGGEGVEEQRGCCLLVLLWVWVGWVDTCVCPDPVDRIQSNPPFDRSTIPHTHPSPPRPHLPAGKRPR